MYKAKTPFLSAIYDLKASGIDRRQRHWRAFPSSGSTPKTQVQRTHQSITSSTMGKKPEKPPSASKLAKLANKRRDDLIAAMAAVVPDPPPYTSRAPSEEGFNNADNDGGPGASRTGLSLGNLDFTPSPHDLPTVAECIAHLKLLHAFSKLRHEVGHMAGLYGIHIEGGGSKEGKEEAPSATEGSNEPSGGEHSEDAKANVSGHDEPEKKAVTSTEEQLREKRWVVFVTKAVDRYERWWKTLPLSSPPFWGPIRKDHFEPCFGYQAASRSEERRVGKECPV